MEVRRKLRMAAAQRAVWSGRQQTPSISSERGRAARASLAASLYRSGAAASAPAPPLAHPTPGAVAARNVWPNAAPAGSERSLAGFCNVPRRR
jgi:hypothetical protein